MVASAKSLFAASMHVPASRIGSVLVSPGFVPSNAHANGAEDRTTKCELATSVILQSFIHTFPTPFLFPFSFLPPLLLYLYSSFVKHIRS